MYRIFLVEDDRGIAEAIAAQTALWDMETVCVRDFRNVMAEFAAFRPFRQDLYRPESTVWRYSASLANSLNKWAWKISDEDRQKILDETFASVDPQVTTISESGSISIPMAFALSPLICAIIIGSCTATSFVACFPMPLAA